MNQVVLDPQPFAALLRAYVAREGVSWLAVARRAFLNPSYVYRLVCGLRTPPSRQVVLSLACGLQLADDETDALLQSAGWAVALEPVAPVVVVRDCPRRPLVRCADCGHEWRGHAGTSRTCSVCARREVALRAARIATFVPPPVRPKPAQPVVELPPRRRSLKRFPVPLPPVHNGTYCRGCRRAFEVSVMVRVHLDGYYCRACHQRKIDRLCEVTS